jgi:hypothetical protein
LRRLEHVRSGSHEGSRLGVGALKEAGTWARAMNKAGAMAGAMKEAGA